MPPIQKLPKSTTQPHNATPIFVGQDLWGIKRQKAGRTKDAPWDEKLANLVFGLNVVGWGIAGIAFSAPVDRWTAVRLSITALHFTVGGLLIFRSPLKISGSVSQIASAIPSLIACGFAFTKSAAPHVWPSYAQTLFVVATLFAIFSLVTLGENFAVLPAVRRITSRGPYRWIRHPAYAGELTMVAACVVAAPNLWTLGALAVAVPCVVLRIVSEERLLTSSFEYERYRERTRWRILPRVW